MLKCKALILIVFFFVEIKMVKAQIRVLTPIEIKCSITKLIKSNSDVLIAVKRVNSSRQTLLIFDSLDYGDNTNKLANFYIELQSKIGKNFKNYNQKAFFDLAPSYDSTLPVPTYKLEQKDSVTNFYYLDNIYQLKRGLYRVKCLYKNDLTKEDKVSSKWVYFTVVNPIDVKHRF
jgi:hypothetical protein